MMWFIKLFFFLFIIYQMYWIGEKYRKENNVKYKQGDFSREYQSLVDWYKGSRETKYYWGFWAPLILFILFLLSLDY